MDKKKFPNKKAVEDQKDSLCAADLIGADLLGADLTDAKLEYADFRGADLRGQNLDNLKSRGARID